MAKCRTSSSIVALYISIGVDLKRNQGNSRPLQPLLSDCGVTGGPEKNDFLLMTVADPHPDPLDMLRIKQEYEVLRHAIDSLPWLLKEGFQIRLNDDLSLSELLLLTPLPACHQDPLIESQRRVIAEAGARLMPHACADSKTEEAAPVLSAESIGAEPAVRYRSSK